MPDSPATDGAMPLSQWLLLLLLAVLWGSAYVLVSVALKELPPLTLVLCRLGLAALVLAAVVQWMVLPWPKGIAGWFPYAVMGVFNNVIPFTVIAYGQLDIASGLAAVIVATTPLWTVVLSQAFGSGGRISAMRLAGIACGVAGVGVLFGPEALAGQRTTLTGMALVLIGSISYGCAGTWGARFRDVPPILSSCCQLVCSSLMMAVLALAIDAPWRLPPPSLLTVASVLFLALVSTAFAYIVFYRVLAVSGGTNVMLVTLIMPPLSIMLGILVLNESFAPRYALGAAIIGLALLLIDGRLPKALFNARR